MILLLMHLSEDYIKGLQPQKKQLRRTTLPCLSLSSIIPDLVGLSLVGQMFVGALPTPGGMM